MSDRTKTFQTSNVFPPKLGRKRNPSPYSHSGSWFQGMLEGYVEGILLLTEQGECLYANERARLICALLDQPESPTFIVPPEIWQVCLSVIESQTLFPNQRVIIESEIVPLESTVIRIQAQWFDLSKVEQPCLLIMLEDLTELR